VAAAEEKKATHTHVVPSAATVGNNWQQPLWAAPRLAAHVTHFEAVDVGIGARATQPLVDAKHLIANVAAVFLATSNDLTIQRNQRFKAAPQLLAIAAMQLLSVRHEIQAQLFIQPLDCFPVLRHKGLRQLVGGFLYICNGVTDYIAHDVAPIFFVTNKPVLPPPNSGRRADHTGSRRFCNHRADFIPRTLDLL